MEEQVMYADFWDLFEELRCRWAEHWSLKSGPRVIATSDGLRWVATFVKAEA